MFLQSLKVIFVPEQLRAFCEREIIEIKKHKLRIGALFIILICAILFFIFSDSDNESLVVLKESQAKKIDDNVKNNSNEKSKKKSKKRVKILGYDKALEEVNIVNPFKVDINPSITENKPVENKTAVSVPVVKNNPAPPTVSISEVKPKDKAILILKGTVISDDKKLATIQRIVINNHKNYNQESKNHDEDINSKYKTETRLVQIGDMIDDRQIIDIAKDYLEFGDGERLTIFNDDMSLNIGEGQIK